MTGRVKEVDFMDIDNKLYGAVGLGVKVEDEADSVISNFIASNSVLKTETGIVELFKEIPLADQIKQDKVKHEHSVRLFTEAKGELVEDTTSITFESPSVTLRKHEVQQQILNNAIKVADDLDIDDDLDVADSFEASFGDLSGFAAAEGFFDNIDKSFDFGEDERAIGVSHAKGDDLTGVNSLVIDDLTNASNPFMALRGINRLGFITEDFKQMQNDRLLGKL
jgi:hypothetical protein